MISEKKIDEVEEMKNNGLEAEDVAKQLNIAIRTARRYLRYVDNRNKEPRKGPKVLTFDIETAEMLIRTWGVGYKQRPHSRQIKEEWYCLAWSAKWLFDNEIMSDVVSSKEAVNRDDKRLLNGIWRLIDEADVLIAHNGLKFDIRKLNARFIKNQFMPPHSYQFIDTLKASKKHFGFSAYNLDYLCGFLGLNRKLATDYELWDACVEGDKKALKKMQEYNKQDVLALEDFYVKIRPWIKSHPNLGVYAEFNEPRCHICLSEDLTWKGHYYTPAGRFESCRCNKCTTLGRSGKSDISKEEREVLVRATAR